MYAYPGDTLPEVESNATDLNPREIKLPRVFQFFNLKKLNTNLLHITLTIIYDQAFIKRLYTEKPTVFSKEHV